MRFKENAYLYTLVMLAALFYLSDGYFPALHGILSKFGALCGLIFLLVLIYQLLGWIRLHFMIWRRGK